MQSRHTFDAAAVAFLDLAARVPLDRYAEPGLGEWDVRALIGHTSRSLVTVTTYLGTRAASVAVESPAAYYVAVNRFVDAEAGDAIRRRGVDAGLALGDDPLATLRQQKADADAALDALDGDPVVETIAGGMRVSDYLPTRTFELTVHSLDIARATGLDFTAPSAALAEALALAGESAVELGLGADVLLALTGRQPLPPGCSVVP
ncbi:MAG TPA: maleylpyruvate isomerase N-terminal domain-containing protein [Nocardioides sp.]|nr:maleylpyruvate isomerase N-terminal domain-containing protein [Nocardioides sp.]